MITSKCHPCNTHPSSWKVLTETGVVRSCEGQTKRIGPNQFRSRHKGCIPVYENMFHYFIPILSMTLYLNPLVSTRNSEYTRSTLHSPFIPSHSHAEFCWSFIPLAHYKRWTFTSSTLLWSPCKSPSVVLRLPFDICNFIVIFLSFDIKLNILINPSLDPQA
jgi:hypothetical protein